LKADPEVTVNILNSTSGWSITERLARLRRPVEIVIGGPDPTLVSDEEQQWLAVGAA
jgi:hypothetical protein